MQQQHQQAAAHPMPAIPPANITTEQIQKYLDENKQLILAILENQNLGKLAECAQYQNQLQKNLLYLAAIADAQPQASAVRPPQMMPHGAVPPGGHYMQQAPIFPTKPPLQFNPNPQQVMQEQQQQMHQLHHPSQVLPFPGHMGMRPGLMNGMHPMHPEASLGGGSTNDLQPSAMADYPRGISNAPSSSIDARGNKQDAVGTAPDATGAADGHRTTSMDRGSGDGEPTQSKRPEDNKTP
ncbi:SS18 family protein [Dioscorea alata]|uniref:SS18 family protein n=1 Tax=Dioscorea alata TaxID=55571 RepID=A0ACB7U835_DIOAL|nr:SS18 family protein [Dioscorea alata]